MEDSKLINKIIAISGEPVTGKSTTMKALVKKLKELGYAEENIHLESTGHEFREYFNKTMELLSNIDNKEKVEKLANDSKLREWFSKPEYRTMLIEAATKLKSKHKNISDINISEFMHSDDLAAIRRVIDSIIDEGIKTKFSKINETKMPDDIWIVDSRLAFHNIPESFSVRLTCDSDIAAKRLMEDKSRGKEDNSYNSIEEAKRSREERRIGEIERYKKRYGIDLDDPENYNIVIDTSYSSIDDIADVILKCLELESQNKWYAKNWTTPKRFLPTQRIMQTCGRAQLTLKEVEESIEKNGYDPSEPIDVLKADGLMAVYEGHHRNFAMLLLGKTLIPYEIIAEEDENIYDSKNTAKDIIERLSVTDVYDHENKNFKYEEIYGPEIYERIIRYGDKINNQPEER